MTPLLSIAIKLSDLH